MVRAKISDGARGGANNEINSTFGFINYKAGMKVNWEMKLDHNGISVVL